MKTLISNIFCLGLGYVATHLKNHPDLAKAHVTGTRRAHGAHSILFDGTSASSTLVHALKHCQNLLISIPPDGDKHMYELIKEPLLNSNVRWIGYLSATSIYGNADGGWVDETTPPHPTTELGESRLKAEQAWLSVFHEHGLPVHVFRLSGIYGPGRSALNRIVSGTAQNIVKEGIVFSRIHVDDIVEILIKSMLSPNPGEIYNVSDDLPASPQAILEFASHLLHRPSPEPIPLEKAVLSPKALQFYQDSKKVSNSKIKRTLIKQLIHPTYKEGLKSILEKESCQKPESLDLNNPEKRNPPPLHFVR